LHGVGLSSEIVAEMADNEGTLTALLTKFRSSCLILEASTSRNDLPHEGSCITGSPRGALVVIWWRVGREWRGVDTAMRALLRCLLTFDVPATSSSKEEESLSGLPRRLRAPAAMAPSCPQRAGWLTSCSLATISVHSNLISRNRTKGDQLRSSCSVPAGGVAEGGVNT
jgi:hypothetical protein